MSNKLNMVNSVLLELNESPVNSLDNSRIVKNILVVMERMKRTLLINQGNGWTFNRSELGMTQDVQGHYPVPEGTLDIDVEEYTGIVIKKGKLFNVASLSYTDIPATSIYAIMDVDYEDVNQLVDNCIVFSTAWMYKKIYAFSATEVQAAYTQYAIALNELQTNDIYKFQQDRKNNNRFNNNNSYSHVTSAGMQIKL